jgi:vanillate monooxygenase ferredoxin subunit
VLREEQSRGGSKTLFESVQTGDVLNVSTPRNHFQLVPTSPRNVLFAGGIGITPLLSMAEWLAYVGGDFHLHYSAKSKERAAFADYIAASPFAAQVSFHFSDGAQQQKLDLGSVLKADGYSHAYVCGPEGYMTKVLETARDMGWPNGRLHREYFAATAIQGDDVEFKVKIASTGQIFVVPPSVSVAEVLKSNGIQVSLSCEQGLCGACLTRVLEGALDHRDHFLMPDEHAANDQFTACCSRGKGGTVVLDI